ncbi:MAG: hypothetical protein LBR39_06300, partial [Coriobacteriales bacterium]|nr:hypothetical protein [Coriobacteriales bacterium]
YADSKITELYEVKQPSRLSVEVPAEPLEYDAAAEFASDDELDRLILSVLGSEQQPAAAADASGPRIEVLSEAGVSGAKVAAGAAGVVDATGAPDATDATASADAMMASGAIAGINAVSGEPVSQQVGDAVATAQADEPATAQAEPITAQAALEEAMDFTDSMIQQVLNSLHQQAAQAAAEAVVAQQNAIQERIIKTLQQTTGSFSAQSVNAQSEYRGRHYKPGALENADNEEPRLWAVPPMKHARISISQQFEKVG